MFKEILSIVDLSHCHADGGESPAESHHALIERSECLKYERIVSMLFETKHCNAFPLLMQTMHMQVLTWEEIISSQQPSALQSQSTRIQKQCQTLLKVVKMILSLISPHLTAHPKHREQWILLDNTLSADPATAMISPFSILQRLWKLLCHPSSSHRSSSKDEALHCSVIHLLLRIQRELLTSSLQFTDKIIGTMGGLLDYWTKLLEVLNVYMNKREIVNEAVGLMVCLTSVHRDVAIVSSSGSSSSVSSSSASVANTFPVTLQTVSILLDVLREYPDQPLHLVTVNEEYHTESWGMSNRATKLQSQIHHLLHSLCHGHGRDAEDLIDLLCQQSNKTLKRKHCNGSGSSSLPLKRKHESRKGLLNDRRAMVKEFLSMLVEKLHSIGGVALPNHAVLVDEVLDLMNVILQCESDRDIMAISQFTSSGSCSSAANSSVISVSDSQSNGQRTLWHRLDINTIDKEVPAMLTTLESIGLDDELFLKQCGRITNKACQILIGLCSHTEFGYESLTVFLDQLEDTLTGKISIDCEQRLIQIPEDFSPFYEVYGERKMFISILRQCIDKLRSNLVPDPVIPEVVLPSNVISGHKHSLDEMMPMVEDAIEKNDPIAEIPKTVLSAFLCPLSGQRMSDPVMLADGYSYERSQVLKWLQMSEHSPITRQKLEDMKYTPNHSLKKAIEEYCEERGIPLPSPINQPLVIQPLQELRPQQGSMSTSSVLQPKSDRKQEPPRKKKK
jgi:hypothetical protein